MTMAAAATSTRNADRSMKKALPVKPAALIFIAVFYAGQLVKLIINDKAANMKAFISRYAEA